MSTTTAVAASICTGMSQRGGGAVSATGLARGPHGQGAADEQSQPLQRTAKRLKVDGYQQCRTRERIYGIDAQAHRAALAADRFTIAVLACGPDIAYPAEHRDLLDAITDRGAVISEWPPGSPPARARFPLRNRTIAALAGGTVVIEAAQRSGAVTAARHAEDLGRP